MEDLYFEFVAWLSVINVAICFTLFIIYNDKDERQRAIKLSFRAFSYWLPISTTIHVIAIALSFFVPVKAFAADGPSILSALCVSIFLLCPVWVLYMKQKNILKSKKYMFVVTDVQNREEKYYNLKGYIFQDCRKFNCVMRDTSWHVIGSKIEVDVWSIPFFGAFIVGEDLDF
ncbi:MAG: hypothetical protein ACK5N8_00655 [Alphaproteobacteria bacterium]